MQLHLQSFGIQKQLHGASIELPVAADNLADAVQHLIRDVCQERIKATGGKNEEEWKTFTAEPNAQPNSPPNSSTWSMYLQTLRTHSSCKLVTCRQDFQSKTVALHPAPQATKTRPRPQLQCPHLATAQFVQQGAFALGGAAVGAARARTLERRTAFTTRATTLAQQLAIRHTAAAATAEAGSGPARRIGCVAVDAVAVAIVAVLAAVAAIAVTCRCLFAPPLALFALGRCRAVLVRLPTPALGGFFQIKVVIVVIIVHCSRGSGRSAATHVRRCCSGGARSGTCCRGSTAGCRHPAVVFEGRK